MQMSRTASLMKMLKPSSSQQVTKVPEARQDGRETPKQRASKVITFSQVVREAKKENAVATRAFVIDELVKTEREYVKHLDILVNVYNNRSSRFVNYNSGIYESHERAPPTGNNKSNFQFHQEYYDNEQEIVTSTQHESGRKKFRHDWRCVVGFCMFNLARHFSNDLKASELNYYATYCNNLESASLNLERSRRESEDLNSFLEVITSLLIESLITFFL